MSSASKVGEIFTAAGAAFTKLGDLTLQLHPTSEQSPSSGKWTPHEVDMLKNAVKRSQIKTQMKRKAYEDAGLPQPTEPSPKKQAVRAEKTPQVTVATATASTPVESQSKKQPQNDVTLSALNAPESDVDIEGDSSSSKRLDFDSGTVIVKRERME
uniref:Chromatin complexes subunit BAP18-like isoform X3 n=1 Tax=Crassostrea virginica TaxID=6565 RepID=A0A8B8EB17_CRAVI|nr:chromatin complexes subunit BAP18-like isoform X3 [Crassostrea virginica]